MGKSQNPDPQKLQDLLNRLDQELKPLENKMSREEQELLDSYYHAFRDEAQKPQPDESILTQIRDGILDALAQNAGDVVDITFQIITGFFDNQ